MFSYCPDLWQGHSMILDGMKQTASNKELPFLLNIVGISELL